MDKVREHFLDDQQASGLELSAHSDLVDIEPLDRQRYVVGFRCNGLIRTPTGTITLHDHFVVGIRFPDDYLRVVRPPEVLTWMGPSLAWHPNIAPPFICIGHIEPGTPLVELVYRCFGVITYENVTMDENDALCHAACSWARRHRERFPVDTRPLKRRAQAPAQHFAGATQA